MDAPWMPPPMITTSAVRVIPSDPWETGRISLVSRCQSGFQYVAFTPGHAGGHRQVAGDVQDRAAHVEKTVDPGDDADPFGRYADRHQEGHHQGERSPGHARRADAREDRKQHH